jgi:hypothetical protein
VIVSDVEHASVLYDLLAPFADLNAVDQAEGMRGSVRRSLGLLAALAGRDDAALHFEAAIEVNERMGLRPWVARTQADFGRFLLAQGEDARGSELLQSAAVAFGEMGMHADLRSLS